MASVAVRTDSDNDLVEHPGGEVRSIGRGSKQTCILLLFIRLLCRPYGVQNQPVTAKEMPLSALPKPPKAAGILFFAANTKTPMPPLGCKPLKYGAPGWIITGVCALKGR